MKKTMLFLLVSLPIIGKAQETLLANDTQVVTLFFPSPIRQAVTGAEHFTFSYNRDSGQHFGLLQASKGTDSNLLVLTKDGQVYSYGLSYRTNLLENYRFVHINESIGQETETKVVPPIPIMDSTSNTPKPVRTNPNMELMVQGADYLLNKTSKTLRAKRKNGLILRLKEVFYHSDKVYVELEIQNNTPIDFELDRLEVYRVNGGKGKRSSHQKLPMAPIFKHQEPRIIRVGNRHGFVYVLPKFTLGDTERLQVELREKRGNRTLSLFHK